MHEATRRTLSVLLRKLEGFECNESTVLVGATNRPQARHGGARAYYPRQPAEGCGTAAPGLSVTSACTPRAYHRMAPLGTSAWYLRVISQDLDPALLSRFQLRVTFPLPDTHARRDIFRTYARHLPDDALGELSRRSAGASGRDIRDVCEATDRRWAARRVRGESVAVGLKLPPVDEYVASLSERGEAQRAHAPPVRGT